MRNEIRALMTSLGIPSFFVTVNPADVYSPILKFLCQQDFDIDNMVSENIPNYWDQAFLISKNPYLAAQFFDIFMRAFIKTLLKYDPHFLNEEGGVLGHVKGYYGCVKAQGRGSLHCHMLVWVEGSLNPDDLKKKILNDNDFKHKIIRYLEDTIRTSVPSIPDPDVVFPSDEFEPSRIRGLNKGLLYQPGESE
jgi:helitron helicase-like protein